ncbi:MAG TPA: dephospho-CoA kinase [Solirubrobacteraceae bacterium]|nr:dephospho-CoA kinase [Solirubrobacteraceae bacterium]
MGAQEVPLLGLTGGMGAGKSTALEALERLGAATLSTDTVVHELYGDERLRDLVVERWGPDVAPGGVVDRAQVAARAFASAPEREWLEGVLWPMVGERMAQWLAAARARRPAPRAAVVEVPLLFEAGMEGAFDATIAVIAEEATRSERASGRGHALESERAARQLPQEEKARRATYVVRNDGSEADLAEQLSGVLEKLGR